MLKTIQDSTPLGAPFPPVTPTTTICIHHHWGPKKVFAESSPLKPQNIPRKKDHHLGFTIEEAKISGWGGGPSFGGR